MHLVLHFYKCNWEEGQRTHSHTQKEKRKLVTSNLLMIKDEVWWVRELFYTVSLIDEI